MKKNKVAPAGIGQTQLRINVPTVFSEFIDDIAKHMGRNGLCGDLSPAQRREFALRSVLTLGLRDLLYENYRQDHGDEALAELIAEDPNGDPFLSWAMNGIRNRGRLN